MAGWGDVELQICNNHRQPAHMLRGGERRSMERRGEIGRLVDLT